MKSFKILPQQSFYKHRNNNKKTGETLWSKYKKYEKYL